MLNLTLDFTRAVGSPIMCLGNILGSFCGATSPSIVADSKPGLDSQPT